MGRQLGLHRLLRISPGPGKLPLPVSRVRVVELSPRPVRSGGRHQEGFRGAPPVAHLTALTQGCSCWDAVSPCEPFENRLTRRTTFGKFLTFQLILRTSDCRMASMLRFALCRGEDIGRHYEAIIRVNSQSGKVRSNSRVASSRCQLREGGIAYILEQEYGIALPKETGPKS